MTAFDLIARGLAAQALAPWRAGPFAALAEGGLATPEASHILSWDADRGGLSWLQVGSGLSMAGGTLTGDGGGTSAPTGWSKLEQVPAAGLSAATFTHIAPDYADLLIQLEGVSHNNPSSASLQLALSADGATYSSAANISTTVSQSGSFHGAVHIPMCRANSGILLASTANLLTSPGLSAISNNAAWRLTGGIAAVRLLPSAGAFDDGTVTLYGR